MNDKKQWGYHPLVVTLANTQEVLYIHNRNGSRPSHENSGFFFDLSIEVVRAAGFQEILLRGDNDFPVTFEFDRWDDDGLRFLFGCDAKPNLQDIAESLGNEAWKPFRRRHPAEPKTARRSKHPDYKRHGIEEREYLDKRLIGEWITEFDYVKAQNPGIRGLSRWFDWQRLVHRTLQGGSSPDVAKQSV